jgi:hypothetical protein
MRKPPVPGVTLLLPLVTLFALWSGSASAQGRPDSFELTLGGGGYFGGTFYRSTTANNFTQLDLSTTGLWGAGLAYNFNRAIGIEFVYSHAEPSLETEHNHVHLGTVKIDNYEMNGNFAFGGYRIVGYFSFGAGATHFNPENAGTVVRSDTRFTGNIGGGCKFYLSDHFAFRVDGRVRATDTNVTTSNVYCDFNGVCYTYHDNWYYSGSATGGIVFAF